MSLPITLFITVKFATFNIGLAYECFMFSDSGYWGAVGT